jgi:hypothetical protein
MRREGCKGGGGAIGPFQLPEFIYLKNEPREFLT